jgi:hypothetical protein
MNAIFGVDTMVKYLKPDKPAGTPLVHAAAAPDMNGTATAANGGMVPVSTATATAAR